MFAWSGACDVVLNSGMNLKSKELAALTLGMKMLVYNIVLILLPAFYYKHYMAGLVTGCMSLFVACRAIGYVMNHKKLNEQRYYLSTFVFGGMMQFILISLPLVFPYIFDDKWKVCLPLFLTGGLPVLSVIVSQSKWHGGLSRLMLYCAGGLFIHQFYREEVKVLVNDIAARLDIWWNGFVIQVLFLHGLAKDWMREKLSGFQIHL